MTASSTLEMTDSQNAGHALRVTGMSFFQGVRENA